MELWHIPYADVMGMPLSRRKRLVKKKVELEQKRDDAQRQQASQSRSRVRR